MAERIDRTIRFIDTHLDGTPWALTMAEVTIEIAIGRARQRLRDAAVVPEIPPDDAPRKKCRHCKLWRLLDKFNDHPTTADGKDGRCRDCKRIYDREQAAKRRAAAGRG